MLQDEDYIIRQVQQLAKGLGKFLGIEGIKDILLFEQEDEAPLTDEQLESIVLMTRVEEIKEEKNYSITDLSQKLGIETQTIEDLLKIDRYASEEELAKLRKFVDQNT